jgi:hypothetical protein
MNGRINGTLRRGIGFALIALMAFGALSGGALAHGEGTAEDGSHGTITVHDTEDGPPTDSIECEFWVGIHNMTHSSGTLEATQREGHAHAHGHDLGNGTWVGTENETGTGYDFYGGPYTTHAADTYRIEVFTFMEDGNHSEGIIVDYRACDQPPREEPRSPEGVDGIQVQAMNDGSIELSWDAPDRAEEYTVMRGTGEGYVEIATVENTTYVDTDTEAETTYEYRIDAANEGGQNLGCQYAEATTIPFFPSPALVAMAALGSVGAVGALRVRWG